MRQSIGSTATFNIIFIFILIVFGVLCATLSYYKAFTTNSKILASIDKFEGYNDLSKSDISTYLDGIGYKKGDAGCESTRNVGGSEAILVGTGTDKYNAKQDTNYMYCVYYYADDRGKGQTDVNGNEEPIYYNYSVVTYIFVDLPILDAFRIPVHTKGERIYNFSKRVSG